jgi:two-component system, OmpR family, alkaline phosphatase synthesis response regulator PhoP
MEMKRVLIIDDEETIQTVVRFGICMAASWEVLTASSGLEGIQTAQSEEIDVILLDVMMPDMDGIATFQALKTYPETEQIPVIFLTAKAQTSEKVQLNNLGVSGVITKPFNSLDLPGQISKILRWDLRP